MVMHLGGECRSVWPVFQLSITQDDSLLALAGFYSVTAQLSVFDILN